MFHRIDDLADVRLAPYRNLKERTLRGESIFIAEGTLVVERLLRSQFGVDSILLFEPQRGNFPWELAPPEVPVWLIDDKRLFDEIVGFPFHQGVLAVGQRGNLPTFFEGAYQAEKTVALSHQDQSRNRTVWIILPRATKPDNLGLAFRSAAALGASAVVLGEQCCDPFSRRALRVSMGGVFQVPIWQAVSLAEEIEQLRKELDITIFATILDEQAEPLYHIHQWPDRTGFLFGNEYDGLSPEEISWADRKLMIPIYPDVDSLNLGVAVGVFLYEYQRENVGSFWCHQN